MKLKLLLVTALFVAGLAASVAVAKGPPPGKGKDKGSTSSSTSTATTAGPGKGKGKKKSGTCKATVTFMLKGEFAGAGAAAAPAGAVPAAGPAPAVLATFSMDVKQANSHGRKYVGETATISVDSKTTFRRRGHAELEDFEEGDWLNVRVRACHPKKEEAATTGPASSDQPVLLARRVVGKPAKGSETETETTDTP